MGDERGIRANGYWIIYLQAAGFKYRDPTNRERNMSPALPNRLFEVVDFIMSQQLTPAMDPRHQLCCTDLQSHADPHTEGLCLSFYRQILNARVAAGGFVGC